MLNISLFRNEETFQKILDSEKNRFKDTSMVYEIQRLDKEWIQTDYELSKVNSEVNSINNQLKEAYKQSKNDNEKIIENLKASKIELENKKQELSQRNEILKNKKFELLGQIGNILDKDVPIYKTEEGNGLVRTYDAARRIVDNPKGYPELMKAFTNSDAGSEVFGHRGYYLSGKMALLARALKNYAIDFLISKGYEYVQPPVMIRKEVMGKTSQLSDFDEQLYAVDGGFYLIATSEQPLTALYMDKKLVDCDLPKLLAGDSLCFRREAGAYGKDNAGIFRVHQFEKVEQFILCNPNESDAMLERMISLSEEFYKTLGLSYQVVLVASGEMNDAAAKKYDLEAWFPNAKKYRELVSASNCTDYQSRNLNVGYRYPKAGEKQTYVHMLNATLCAVQRTLCCIIENYQENDKIVVPDVLKPYKRFDEFDI